MGKEEKNMVNYKKIDDISAYVQELAAKGELVFTAEKAVCIAARKGEIGERVISWSVDAAGNPILEKEAQVTADPETGEAGWVAAKIDDAGQKMVDQNGNVNEWIIEDSVFRKKYKEDPARAGIYKPVGSPQKFMRLSEAVTIEQWGSEMNVDAGGFINVTNPDDIYVISGRDFKDTYKVLGGTQIL